MNTHQLHRRGLALVASLAFLSFSGTAAADPPSRVARLGYATGAVSFSPAGDNDWVQANVNRPLTNGDRLWADARSRAEIQVGGAMVRMDSGTGVSVLNLDDRIAQLQLTQGTLSVRVRRLDPGQAFEVDTPNLAFTLREPGEYRIAVDPDGMATTIAVRRGQGVADGDGAAYTLDARQPYRFSGTDLRDLQYTELPRNDDFDRWVSDRDRAYDNSASARYVSPDVVGYQDLDGAGTWRTDATYGNVWMPNRVAADWAPYRDGHWAWVDPWGWTWVDDAPWGYAVSHYGRWARIDNSWGWVPGPVRQRAYYAPALVAFVGGDNFRLSITIGDGGVAWFPLAPREVYRPAYPASREYFENVNRSNTVINNTVIHNTYNNINVTNVTYANRRVPGAVVAVPNQVFLQSQPVARAVVKLPKERADEGTVVVAAPLAPTVRSVRGSAERGEEPPARVFARPVLARSAPPAAHAGLTAQQPQLSARPGRPLDEAERKALEPQPQASAPVRVVTVVKGTPAEPRGAPPVPKASASAPTARPPEASREVRELPEREPEPARAAPPKARDNPRGAPVPRPPASREEPREESRPVRVARPPAARASEPAASSPSEGRKGRPDDRPRPDPKPRP